MTTDDDFDRRIQEYLEPGPAELADRVLVAARAQLETTRRRRSGFAWLAPWRNPNMTRNTRLLLVGGGALVIAIGAGLFGSIFARPNSGPGSSGSPPASGFSATDSAPSSTVAPLRSSSDVPARAAGWYPTGGMIEARTGHTATLLSDGKVLVAGGRIGPDGHAPATSAELYDPSSATWSATGSMHDGRSGQTATLLPDGRVLVAGGSSGGDGSLATAELYGPVSGTWTATADMLVAGQGQTATLLSNGKVLVVGGVYGPPQQAELYDPISGTWTATGFRTTRGSGHTATLLPDGKVLVVGFTSRVKDGASSAELYDPSSGSWSATGNLAHLNTPHTATLLPDGSVLVVGCGADVGKGKPTANAELYDPISGSWKVVGQMLENHGIACAATLLADGRVLVAGGSNETSGSASVLASAEVYDPGTRTWTPAQNMGTARAGQTATLLPGGQVLVAGGQNVISGLFSPVASAELYDPGRGN
jgi:Kelch motif